MESRILVVTDLTRFRSEDIVCIAGMDPENGQCLRPRPYRSPQVCRELGIRPGMIVTGEFRPYPNIALPHVEDTCCEAMRRLGSSRVKEFQSLLRRWCTDSVAEGFGMALEEGQRHIPRAQAPARSIVTVAARPKSFRVKAVEGKPTLRVSFRDREGKGHFGLSLTDLGFYQHCRRAEDKGVFDMMLRYLCKQEEMFLRIGLSRLFDAGDGRCGYWLQVNGVYTFPGYIETIRCLR
jgi:hypothetical protein